MGGRDYSPAFGDNSMAVVYCVYRNLVCGSEADIVSLLMGTADTASCVSCSFEFRLARKYLNVVVEEIKSFRFRLDGMCGFMHYIFQRHLIIIVIS